MRRHDRACSAAFPRERSRAVAGQGAGSHLQGFLGLSRKNGVEAARASSIKVFGPRGSLRKRSGLISDAPRRAWAPGIIVPRPATQNVLITVANLPT